MCPHAMLRLELSCSRSLPAKPEATANRCQCGFRLQPEERGSYFSRNFFIRNLRLALSDDM